MFVATSSFALSPLIMTVFSHALQIPNPRPISTLDILMAGGENEGNHAIARSQRTQQGQCVEWCGESDTTLRGWPFGSDVAFPRQLHSTSQMGAVAISREGAHQPFICIECVLTGERWLYQILSVHD